MLCLYLLSRLITHEILYTYINQGIHILCERTGFMFFLRQDSKYVLCLPVKLFPILFLFLSSLNPSFNSFQWYVFMKKKKIVTIMQYYCITSVVHTFFYVSSCECFRNVSPIIQFIRKMKCMSIIVVMCVQCT